MATRKELIEALRARYSGASPMENVLGDREIPLGPPDMPKLLAVLDRHGVTVAA